MDINSFLLIFMAVCLTLGALKGLSRGIGRQAVRTITVVVALIVSLVLTKGFSTAIYSEIANMSPEEMAQTVTASASGFDGIDLKTILENVSPETISYIMAIPCSLLLMPIIFVLAFVILKLLLLIVHAILAGVCGFSKKRNNALTRLLGAVLGAVQGIACAVIITMPIVGIATTARDVVYNLKEESDDEAVVEVADGIYEAFSGMTDSGMAKFFGAVGGNALYNQFTDITIIDKTYNIPKEVATPLVKIIAASPKLENFDWKNMSKENKDGMFLIIDAVDESEYFKKISLDIVDSAVSTYQDGALAVEADDLLVEVVDSAFIVLSSIDENSFATDIKTIFNTYAILGREGAFTAFEAGELEEVRKVLTSEYTYVEGDPITSSDSEDGKVTVLKKVTEILNENSHTKHLVSALSKISVSVLAQSFGSELEVEEIYDTVKSGLTNTLQIKKEEGKSEDEYKAEVKESIDTALKEVDIELEDGVLDEMAEYVNQNYDTLVEETGGGEITDEKINELILSYYDAYIAAGGSVDNLPEGLPDDLGGLNP